MSNSLFYLHGLHWISNPRSRDYQVDVLPPDHAAFFSSFYHGHDNMKPMSGLLLWPGQNLCSFFYTSNSAT